MATTAVRRLPGRLTAPEPGWTDTADVVVVGSGIAGLTAALRLHASRHEPGGITGKVIVVTKDVLAAGSTQWAQGGIAAALGPGDSPDQHERDTLVAGAGACDREAVRALVTEGPAAVMELIELGTEFDLHPDGELSLTREGGHLRDRIAHAGGDATGAEIQRALIAAVRRAPEIEVVEHALVVDLALAEDGAVAGVTLHVMGEGQRDGTGLLRTRAVVLASGGLGQVFSQTTNPAVSTADGMAVALRAGATLRDLEFVQFHPTVMYVGPGSTGQQPLISEAVRGEGAFLVDWDGNRIMAGVHPLEDLAPRDVVSKAIMARMLATGRPHMWLDARHVGRPAGRAAEALAEACRDQLRNFEANRVGLDTDSLVPHESGSTDGQGRNPVGRADEEGSRPVGRADDEGSGPVGRAAGALAEACRDQHRTSEGDRVGLDTDSLVPHESGSTDGSDRSTDGSDRSTDGSDRSTDGGAAFWERRFPTIWASCKEHGIDPTTDLIPVAPACHYASGGVRTDLWGRTAVPGLYATGEVACSGVHGANRLASNSLLEGLVFSRRIAEVLPGELRPLAEPALDRREPGLVAGSARTRLQEIMTSRVGVLRTAEGLREAGALLDTLLAEAQGETIDVESWEVTNLLTISTALTQAALRREETRGSHWREDFPDRDDDHLAGHIDIVVREGVPQVAFTPAAATDLGTDSPPAAAEETS